MLIYYSAAILQRSPTSRDELHHTLNLCDRDTQGEDTTPRGFLKLLYRLELVAHLVDEVEYVNNQDRTWHSILNTIFAIQNNPFWDHDTLRTYARTLALPILMRSLRLCLSYCFSEAMPVVENRDETPHVMDDTLVNNPVDTHVERLLEEFVYLLSCAKVIVNCFKDEELNSVRCAVKSKSLKETMIRQLRHAFEVGVECLKHILGWYTGNSSTCSAHVLTTLLTPHTRADTISQLDNCVSCLLFECKQSSIHSSTSDMLETILVGYTEVHGENRILTLQQRECVYSMLASKLNFVSESSIPSCYFQLLLRLVRLGSCLASPGMSECLVREILRIDEKIRSSQTKDMSTETNVPGDYKPVPQGRIRNTTNSRSSTPNGIYDHLITMLTFFFHRFVILLTFSS